MTRHFVLGNSSILVGMDKHGRVRDFYYPYVGQENHVNGNIHRIGVWVNGQFSWFSDDEWQKTISYQKETLITKIIGKNDRLGITLTFQDAVHYEEDILIREVTIKNHHNTGREIRIYFHQQYQISEGNIGDTVYYNPVIDSLIHYKGKRYFLMNGSIDNNKISEYATGLVEEYGREGTYKDAEDGILSNNPIEHGSVDSTLGLYSTIPANKSKKAYYWICVSDCYGTVNALNSKVKKQQPQILLKETAEYWKTWVNRSPFKFQNLPKEVVDLFKRSLMIISTQVDHEGAIIASSDSKMLHLRKDTYSYMWPRDGALIARSLDRAGYNEITESFFNFCCRVITKEGYLFHKYRPDGSLGSSWHSWLRDGQIQLPIQEDETALVLDALWKHYLQHNDPSYIKKLFKIFVRPAANFMLKHIDEKTGLPKESYDLWEEKLGIHTFTCSTVYAGFLAAANFEDEFGTVTKAKVLRQAAERLKQAMLKHLYDEQLGYFIKMVYYENGEMKRDTTLDFSSAYSIFQFDVLPVTDERVTKSMESCKQRLYCNTASGGYARYENDYYYRVDQNIPGNPWFITTLWLAEYYIKKAKTEQDLRPAIEIFKWVTDLALPTGVLPEQIHPHTKEPVSVAPLTWSHAGFVIAIVKYLEKLDELGICMMCNPPKLEKK